MFTRVELDRAAEKAVKKLPQQIALLLAAWVESVEANGLEATRKIPGYHDEPPHGKRRRQRSVRLNRAYRAIYEVHEGEVRVVLVLDVNKHRS